jgi:hypothetical protein
LSCFFDIFDFFFADSGRLLPNATVLMPAFLSKQSLFKRLRLEYELSRYEKINEDNHRYFDKLLKPCEITFCSNKKSGYLILHFHVD